MKCAHTYIQGEDTTRKCLSVNREHLHFHGVQSQATHTFEWEFQEQVQSKISVPETSVSVCVLCMTTGLPASMAS